MSILMVKILSLEISTVAILFVRFVLSRLNSKDLPFALSAEPDCKSLSKRKSCQRIIWLLSLRTSNRSWWRSQIFANSIQKNWWDIFA